MGSNLKDANANVTERSDRRSTTLLSVVSAAAARMTRDLEQVPTLAVGAVLDLGLGTAAFRVLAEDSLDHRLLEGLDLDEGTDDPEGMTSGLAERRPRVSRSRSSSIAIPWIKAEVSPETRQHGLKGGSFLQMLGTFVIDPTGVIRATTGTVKMAHRNRHFADTPSVDRLLAALTASGPRTSRGAALASADGGTGIEEGGSRAAEATPVHSRP